MCDIVLYEANSYIFFFKQKTAYEVRISDWSSEVCSSDLPSVTVQGGLTRLGGSYSVRGVNAGVVSYFSEAPTGPTTIGMPFFDLQSVQEIGRASCRERVCQYV